MVDLIRLPNGSVIVPGELTTEERIACLEALIHLAAPTLARFLAGEWFPGIPTSISPDSAPSAVGIPEEYASLPPVLTVAQTAKVLGVSDSVIYEMTRRWDGKFFPHFRVGNRIRIPRDKLVEWMHNGGVCAYKEDIKKADEEYKRNRTIPRRKY